MDKNSNSSKDKTTALLLALFFGAWTYLYTYKIDKEKFFIFLGSFLLVTIMFPLTYYNLIPMCLFWVGSIIETASRNQQFYIDYDSIKSTKNKSNLSISQIAIGLGFLALLWFVVFPILSEVELDILGGISIFHLIVFIGFGGKFIFWIWDKFPKSKSKEQSMEMSVDEKKELNDLSAYEAKLIKSKSNLGYDEYLKLVKQDKKIDRLRELRIKRDHAKLNSK